MAEKQKASHHCKDSLLLGDENAEPQKPGFFGTLIYPCTKSSLLSLSVLLLQVKTQTDLTMAVE